MELEVDMNFKEFYSRDQVMLPVALNTHTLTGGLLWCVCVCVSVFLSLCVPAYLLL